MKINIGCGNDIKEGYLNIDRYKKEGVTIMNLEKFPYPFKDNSVEEVYASAILEHVKDYEGIIKEIHRILSKDGVFHIFVPHYSCVGAYSEFHTRFFYYNSFTSERLGYVSNSFDNDIYNKFTTVKKVIHFPKPYFFMSIFKQGILAKVYENTILSSLFPANNMEVILIKK